MPQLMNVTQQWQHASNTEGIEWWKLACTIQHYKLSTYCHIRHPRPGPTWAQTTVCIDSMYMFSRSHSSTTAAASVATSCRERACPSIHNGQQHKKYKMGGHAGWGIVHVATATHATPGGPLLLPLLLTTAGSTPSQLGLPEVLATVTGVTAATCGCGAPRDDATRLRC